MPLLDIAISQPSCFRNNILAFRSEAHFQKKLVVGNDRRFGFASAFSWKPFYITKKKGKSPNLGRVDVWRGGLRIRAVATLDIASVTHKNEGVKGYENVLRADVDSLRLTSPAFETKSSSEESAEVKEREKLRRMRISKANKGNTPWNKGRKHSAETLQRIKERTRLAMQNPKVKMKLALGHAQSEETKMKIGVGVRLVWKRRREKLMLQEMCHCEWLDLIAEAARKGLPGEEELQWDSYKMLDRQLEQERAQNVKERKYTPRPKGIKKATKTADQKRKISEAITSAKWANPEYRNQVCSSHAKLHGISEGVERKPSGAAQTRKRSPTKKDEIDNLMNHEKMSQVQCIRLERSKAPVCRDPFASSKLEMLKSIRAQRAALVNQKSKAISRAKLLIAKAEKAAEALEIVAKNSPHVQTSLTESRMLIAEAIQFIKSVENEESLVPFENDNHLSDNSTEQSRHVEQEIDPNIETKDFCFSKVVLPDLNGRASNSCHDGKTEQEVQASSNSLVMNLDDPEANRNGSTEAPKQVKMIKKWVRGKLVEVVEET